MQVSMEAEDASVQGRVEAEDVSGPGDDGDDAAMD